MGVHSDPLITIEITKSKGSNSFRNQIIFEKSNEHTRLRFSEVGMLTFRSYNSYYV